MDSLSFMLYVLVFVFGIIIGSFLNVVIYRFGSGFGFKGRSKCLSCGKMLRAHMLIPVLSFALQRGRCAHCFTKLSWQYPLVELATGILFLASLYHNGITGLPVDPHAAILALCDAAVWSVLVAITVYDLRHKIVPDRLSALFAIIAGGALLLKMHWNLIGVPYIPVLDSVPRWIDLAAAPLVALPFALLWFLSAGRAMGLGDAKLAWGIGWFLGFSKAVSAIVFSFWIAFFPSLFLLLLPRKHFTMKSEIPFAPFLVLGTLAVYISGVDIVAWTF